MANERLAVEWNMPVRIEIIPSFDIEIIAIIRGIIKINKEYSIDDIVCHAKILPEGIREYTFPCTIRTDRLRYSNDLPGYVRLEMYKGIYDNIIQGKVKYMDSNVIDNPDIVPIVDPAKEIKINEIYGTVKLEKYISENYTNTVEDIEFANEIYGTMYIEKIELDKIDSISPEDVPNPIVDQEKGIRTNEIYGRLKYEPMNIEEYKEDIDPYVMHYYQHNEFLGHAKIEKNKIIHTIVDGHGTTRKYNIEVSEPDISDPINTEIDWSDYQMSGSFKYERDQRIIDIYCKVSLEKTGEVNDTYESTIIDPVTEEEKIVLNSNELQCHVKIEPQTIKDEFIDKYRLDPTLKDSSVIIGHAKILNHYRSIDIPCKIKTNNLEFIHSILARIEIPRERNIIIPCRITVDDTNVFRSTILKGYITILPRDKIETDLVGHVKYEPGVCLDIESHAFIDAIYTRKEFDCRIDIIIPKEISILCTIDIAEHKPKPPIEYPPLPPTNHYSIPKDLDPIIDRDPKRVHITIDENNKQNIIQYKEKKPKKYKSHLLKGKIVIAVSPTWNYEPYVFKNSLITFLDRYYRKADIAVVFGGSPRSDFDIVNLCLNYKINKDNLCCIMGDKASVCGQFFVQKFINTMVEFKKDEYPNILRVFMFINQPNWYYNDPLSSLATYCKINNISAVAISPGGEYNEICEIDKIIDDLNSGIEWERQHRNHRTEYINIRLEDNQDRLVY